MESLELLMNDGENVIGGIARLELGDKWVCKKVPLGPFFVFLQGIIKN